MKYERWVKKLEAEREAELTDGVPSDRIKLDAFVEKIIREHGRTPLNTRELPEDLDRLRLFVAGWREPPQKRPKNPKDLESAIRLAMSQRRKRGEDGFGRGLGA